MISALFSHHYRSMLMRQIGKKQNQKKNRARLHTQRERERALGNLRAKQVNPIKFLTPEFRKAWMREGGRNWTQREQRTPGARRIKNSKST